MSTSKFAFTLSLLFTITFSACGQSNNPLSANRVPNPYKVKAEDFDKKKKGKLVTGAEQTEKYLPLLKGKRVGMVVNPTSIIGKQTAVDSLVALGVNIVKIFGPEHGFRGDASAGVSVDDAVDAKTGIRAISLYGKHNKPTKEDLQDVDIMVFDIQDVGVRFYTYINTLQRVMESCAEFGKPLVILDRPNPNGFYIDGPILDPALKSGIGMQAIPIVHGLTVGEYAQMLNGEGWLLNKVKCDIKIIKVANYDHSMKYTLPVKPSPNLNTQQAIELYPTTCLFEGIYVNHGRGTQFPFTIIGSPAYKGIYNFSFTPTGIKGMAETPIFQDQVVYGIDLRKFDTDHFRKTGQINLKWIIDLYKAHPNKADFFNSKLSNQMGSFDKLAGQSSVREMIIAGKSEKEIRASWEPALSKYKLMRKKYLLYP